MTLEILTSEALAPTRHGFFTRRGGVSSGIFAGLNCGLGSSDQRDVVNMNRGLVADAMGLGPSGLISVHQVHSPDVVVVNGPSEATPPEADAVVTATPGIALSILTADCAPILFADAKAGVIGAAHAGWKGALGGVIGTTIDKMIGLGAHRNAISATIGPCISQRNYEVGPEFFDTFMAEDTNFARFFAQGKADHFQFDLPSFCLHILRDAGIEQADWIGHCTYADPDRFYSFRRATHLKEADYGRLIACISLGD